MTVKISLPTESAKRTRPPKLPADDVRARNDIAAAVASINGLLTGDVEHLSDATAADLSRLLENIKHLAEVGPVSKSHERK